jgi:hypothetical protein
LALVRPLLPIEEEAAGAADAATVGAAEPAPEQALEAGQNELLLCLEEMAYEQERQARLALWLEEEQAVSLWRQAAEDEDAYDVFFFTG